MALVDVEVHHVLRKTNSLWAREMRRSLHFTIPKL